jgi:hypothetical protein
VAVYAYGNMHLEGGTLGVTEGAHVGLTLSSTNSSVVQRGEYFRLHVGEETPAGPSSPSLVATTPATRRDSDEPPLLPAALLSSSVERQPHGCVALWSRCMGALRKIVRSGTMSHEQLRPLLSTYGAKQHGAAGAAPEHGAHFVRNELPSSGKLTYESDRAKIVQVETEIRRWFVDHAILSAKARFRAQKGHERTYELRSKQVGCQQTQVLTRALLGDPDLSKLSKLDLAGNLFGHLGVQGLLPLLVSPAASSLTALNLSYNSRLRVKGMAALAEVLSLSRCQIASLELVDCALTPAAGVALSRGLSASRRLRHLDISHNLCDDLAVTTMIDAVQGANRRFSTVTTVVVEGNPLSDGVKQVVGLMHMMAAGIAIDAIPAMPELERRLAPELDEEDEEDVRGSDSDGVSRRASSGREAPLETITVVVSDEDAAVSGVLSAMSTSFQLV